MLSQVNTALISRGKDPHCSLFLHEDRELIIRLASRHDLSVYLENIELNFKS